LLHLAGRPHAGAGGAGSRAINDEDLGEHLSRHRNFGHLEGHVASMADNLRADLHRLLAQAGQRHGSAVFGIAGIRMKLPRLYAST
jgi:hypothetical protein